jgi:ferritin-like metal-binding protein YciE
MAKAAQSEELRDALNSHLEETKGHVERLKQVFESLDEKPKSKTCQAMKGLIEEGSELLQELKGVPLHENLGEDYRDNRVEMVREYRDRPGWS